MSYIHCTKDNAIDLPLQKRMVARAGIEKVATLETFNDVGEDGGGCNGAYQQFRVGFEEDREAESGIPLRISDNATSVETVLCIGKTLLITTFKPLNLPYHSHRLLLNTLDELQSLSSKYKRVHIVGPQCDDIG